MRVQAASGTRCPKQDNPRQYITDNIPVDVPESAYYRRMIADGSLIKYPTPADTAAENTKDKGGKK